jgi:hypothetical protein
MQALARVGIDLAKVDADRFQRFLDEKFPRAEFAVFRDLIDGPDLGETAVREQGLQTIATPQSTLANYRFVVRTRRTLREVATLCSEMAARARRRKLLYPLRICAFCQKLFIARKNNNKYCDPKKCGAAFRQARKRDRDRQRDEYEVRRQQKMARNEQKLKKRP